MPKLPMRAGFVMLAALMLALPPSTAVAQANCSRESFGLTPITEMNGATYMGAEGGLYPGGMNSIPPDHQALGLSLMSLVMPLDAEGRPAEGGSIGFAGVGVSTTGRDWRGFETVVQATTGINPRIVMIDGGLSSHPLGDWVDPTSRTWRDLEERVTAGGLTALQVQVAWVMLPDRPEVPPPFPDRQESNREQLQAVLRTLKANYPNLHLAYLSSHQYAGYSIDEIQEPGTGYEAGFGVKWTIESQIDGDGDINPDPADGPVTAPWIAWGPYTWADGLIPRGDGLIWECSDFGDDGHHPNRQGSRKLGLMLLEFFATDPTTAPWFLAEGVESISSTTASSSPSTTIPAPSSTAGEATTVPQSTATTAAGPAGTETESDGTPTLWLLLAGGVAIAVVAIVVLRRR